MAIRARARGGAGRDAVLARGRELGLLGWVRDGDDDGSLLVHAEGPAAAVDELVAFVGEPGPRSRWRGSSRRATSSSPPAG